MSGQLRDLLERISRPVGEVDFVDVAWRGARQRQARRRRLVLAAVGAAAATALVLVVHPGPSDRTAPVGPTPTHRGTGSLQTSAAPWVPSPARTLADGTILVTGPPIDHVTDLPELRPGLPAVLGWTGTPVTLADAVARATHRHTTVRVVAAMMSRVADSSYVPVLLLKDDATRTESYASVPVTLSATGGSNVLGAPNLPMDLAAISGDGAMVVFVQDTRLVVVDAHLGTVRSLPLPAARSADELPTGAGFDLSDQVIIPSPVRPLSVDLVTGAVTRLARTSSAAAERLELVNGKPVVTPTGYFGDPLPPVAVSAPVSQFWGQSSWVTDVTLRGAFLDAARLPQDRRSGLDGLMVVVEGDPRTVTILTMGDGTGEVKGGIRALGFGAGNALFTYSDSGQTWILGYDPRQGRGFRISQLLPVIAGVGGPGPILALNLG